MYQGRTIRIKAHRRPNASRARRARGVAPRRGGASGRGTGLRLVRIAALAGIVVAGLFLGCTFFTAKEPPAPPPPAIMPMTGPAVSECLDRVRAAKARAGRPEAVEEYVRYAAAVYVEPIRSRYAVAETVATAVRLAAAGDPQAGRFLAGTVRDVQLMAAMGGRTFTVAEWREIYVRSGLLDQETFVAIGGSLGGDLSGQEPARAAPSGLAPGALDADAAEPSGEEGE
jgi:hypothetical protein